MARVHTSLIRPGCAQGRYAVKAKGTLLAVLRWGNDAGPLPGWGPFAYVPVDPAGNGAFFFPGMRGIPPGATRVWARCVAHDFSPMEAVSAEIPPRFLAPEPAGGRTARLSVLTDMHLASKPWAVARALRAARGDVILLLGDSVNDGLPEQFDRLEACVDEAAPDRVVLPVAGNHDIAHPKRVEGDGCLRYAAFQARCLARARDGGVDIRRDPDSPAWAARLEGLDIFGLQCVTSGRQFRFPEGRQLDWLAARLSEPGDADWRLLLCHAPLLGHNPVRSDGQPYLGGDRRLQGIVDGVRNLAFLSGHTHISPNIARGSAEWDAGRNNLYLNCGSVVDTDTRNEDGLMARDWKDGCVTELTVRADEIEIETRSVITGERFPRGYYRFQKEEAARRDAL